MAEAIHYIGIARMGGGIEMGEEKAKALVKSGKAKLLIVASDASEGAKRRAEGYVYGSHVPLAEVPYTKEEISAMSGKAGCSMAAFANLGLADSFAAALRAEYGETYGDLAEALRRKQARASARKTGKRRKDA